MKRKLLVFVMVNHITKIYLFHIIWIGEYRVGVDRVGSPSVCKNVSNEMKLVVQVRNKKIVISKFEIKFLYLAFSRLYSISFISMVFCWNSSWLLETINSSNKSFELFNDNDIILSRTIINCWLKELFNWNKNWSFFFLFRKKSNKKKKN